MGGERHYEPPTRVKIHQLGLLFKILTCRELHVYKYKIPDRFQSHNLQIQSWRCDQYSYAVRKDSAKKNI